MTSQTASDPNTVAYCQNCGRPLTAEERRLVSGAVYCEPCLAERLASAAPPPPGAGYTYTGATPTGAVPFPPRPGAPNPALAAMLGFIPGVGAMYNGQYAKGVVHLVVFAILVSLADQHGIFGILVAGWVFYQPFEAYHTARARRDGLPLPNPFGLNDIGERLGFGKSWPVPPVGSSTQQSPVPPSAAGPSDSSDPSDRSGPSGPFASPSPAYAWDPRSAPSQAEAPRPAEGSARASYAPPGYNSASYTSYNNVPPAPPYTGYSDGPTPEPFVAPRNNVPAGALWLIGLGVLFLIGNAGIFHGFPVHHLLPFLLMGGGLWLFLHKMRSTGESVTDDGSPHYRRRLFSALRGSVWIMLTGVLFFLDSFRILSWGRSWPLWIILAGVMTFLQRTVPPAFYRAPGPYPSPGPYAYGPTSPPPTPAASDPVPEPSTTAAPHDPEGRQI